MASKRARLILHNCEKSHGADTSSTPVLAYACRTVRRWLHQVLVRRFLCLPYDAAAACQSATQCVLDHHLPAQPCWHDSSSHNADIIKPATLPWPSTRPQFIPLAVDCSPSATPPPHVLRGGEQSACSRSEIPPRLGLFCTPAYPRRGCGYCSSFGVELSFVVYNTYGAGAFQTDFPVILKYLIRRASAAPRRSHGRDASNNLS